MDTSDHILYTDFLRGQLEGEQLTAFQARLNTDKKFKLEFDLYKEMEGFVSEKVDKGAALEVLRKVAREERNSVNEISATAASKKTNTRSYWKWLLLAMGLLAIVVFNLISKQNKQPVEYAQLYTEPSWPVTRSDAEDQIAVAVAEFLNGNKEVAIAQLKQLNSDESNYWVAEIYAKEMLGDSVLKYLPVPPKKKIRRDRILYLEILSLYKTGKNEHLKTKFNDLPADIDKFYLDKLASLRL